MRIFIIILICSFTRISAEELRFYGIGEPGSWQAFNIEESADIKGSLGTGGTIDINIGEVKDGCRYPIRFTRKELTSFWKSQAKGKFVYLDLPKSTMNDEEKNKFVRDIADWLFSCGVRRVRIDQTYNLYGPEVIFDEERKEQLSQIALGFYGIGKVFHEIFELEARADRVIWVNKEMKFDVNIGGVEKAKDGDIVTRSPILFDFEKIEYFLKKERHKDLLFIWFDKTIMWNKDEIIADFVSKVETMIRPVGYKRVIILGAHGNGVYFLFDTALTSVNEENKSANN